MPRAPRKPASAQAVPGDPRISSTGVQKPPRTGPANAGPVLPSRIRLAPKLVNIDWLTLNMEAPESSPGIRLPWEGLEPEPWCVEMNAERVYFTVPSTNRTNHFNRITYIHDELDRKVLTVWHDPHSNGMHRPNWIQVQFENATLYTGEWSTLLRMLEAVGCVITAVSKLDVSCDALEGQGGEFLSVIDTTRHGNARFYGHSDWVVRGARSKVTGAELGYRSSNKFVRCYRKKREMKSRGIKQHIVNKWIPAFGFNPMLRAEEVIRFEGSFKGKEVRRYFPDEKARPSAFVHELADTAHLVDVVSSMAMNMLDVRTVATRSRAAQPVAEWDWSGVVPVEPSLAFRATRNYAISDHTVKVELRALFRAAVHMARPELMAFAEGEADAHGEHWRQWFERKKVEWTKAYGKAMKTGDLRTLEYFARLKEPDPGPERMTAEEWESVENYANFNRFASFHVPTPPPFDEPPPEDDDDVNPW